MFSSPRMQVPVSPKIWTSCFYSKLLQRKEFKKEKEKKNLYILNSFQGSLKKLTLEDLTQNHIISSSTLAGIHRRRLVLNYFSSATIHGNVTLISGPKDKNPVLISTNTESVQKEENFPLRS